MLPPVKSTSSGSSPSSALARKLVRRGGTRTAHKGSPLTTGLCLSGADQIPAVAGEVEEDGDPAVRLRARSDDEFHTIGRHSFEGLIEVVHTQEEPDPSGDLIPETGSLFVSVGLRQQNSRLASGRAYDDPSFRSSVVRDRGGILYQIESELFDEELNRRVVSLDDERHKLH